MINNLDKREAIVALDVGTTKILCLVADYNDDFYSRPGESSAAMSK